MEDILKLKKNGEPSRQGEGGGPKTEEGKAISSMNALKTGRYMRNFQRLKGNLAGNLPICRSCGEEQQAECRVLQVCQLQEELVYAYHLAQAERDLQGIEHLNVLQLASMDLLFSQRLRWAVENLGATEKAVDKSGRRITQPVVKNEDIYTLINMMNALNKSPQDMQLTRQTQENINVEWAKLLEAQISQEEALKSRERILEMMQGWGEAKQQASKMAQEDEAIQRWVNTGKLEEDPAAEGKPGKALVSKNPFGDGSNGK